MQDMVRSVCPTTMHGAGCDQVHVQHEHTTKRRVYHFHPIRNSMMTARTMVINTPATNPPTTPPPTPAELAEDDADRPQSLDLAASSSWRPGDMGSQSKRETKDSFSWRAKLTDLHSCLIITHYTDNVEYGHNRVISSNQECPRSGRRSVWLTNSSRFVGMIKSK